MVHNFLVVNKLPTHGVSLVCSSRNEQAFKVVDHPGRKAYLPQIFKDQFYIALSVMENVFLTLGVSEEEIENVT